ncbi:hypothetical protein [Roseobacter ponti]|uniref:Uncharacterized protein n=1 Tax=Roseobacter ponti TaxID=1891787 RepID=A0A858SS88_9RHOB|nr:hypothetical protein [Roseobacter ponti]QJF51535.1 hypothetical protein G3256_10360 [Roseobacter ponti]
MPQKKPVSEKTSRAAADETSVDIEDLLSKGNWEQRLEEARLRREEVLAAREEESPSSGTQTRSGAPAGARAGAGRAGSSRNRPVPAPNAPEAGARARILAALADAATDAAQITGKTLRKLNSIRQSRGVLVPAALAALPALKRPKVTGRSASMVATGAACLMLGYGIGSVEETTASATPGPDTVQATTMQATTAIATTADSDITGTTAITQTLVLPYDKGGLFALSSADQISPELPDPPVFAALSNVTWTSVDPARNDSPPDVRAAVRSGGLPPAVLPLTLSPEKEDWFAGATGLRAPLRMFVYAPESIPRHALDENLSRLGNSEAEIARLQRVNMRISTPHIRYFYAEDADAAMALGESLGIEARDFRHMSGAGTGRVEVWLNGAAVRRRTISPAEQVAQRGFTLLSDLLPGLFR